MPAPVIDARAMEICVVAAMCNSRSDEGNARSIRCRERAPASEHLLLVNYQYDELRRAPLAPPERVEFASASWRSAQIQ